MYREYLKSGVSTEVGFDDKMTCAHCACCIRKCISQNIKKKGGQVSVTTFNPRTCSITANCSHFRPRMQNIMRFSNVARLKSAAATKVWKTDVIQLLRTQRLLHFIDGTSLKPEPDGPELVFIADSNVTRIRKPGYYSFRPSVKLKLATSTIFELQRPNSTSSAIST